MQTARFTGIKIKRLPATVAFFASFDLFYGLPFVASNGSEEWRRLVSRSSAKTEGGNAPVIYHLKRREAHFAYPP
jgi:hypothetical protein